LYNLAVAKLELQQFTDALVMLRRADHMAHSLDRHQWMADAASAQARGHQGLGEGEKARAFFDKALALYRELKDNSGLEWAAQFSKDNNYPVVVVTNISMPL
jgi:hypothetical protein